MKKWNPIRSLQRWHCAHTWISSSTPGGIFGGCHFPVSMCKLWELNEMWERVFYWAGLSTSYFVHQVEYDADGWLEKNRDTIPSGLMEMLRQSKNQLISLIFKGRLTRTGTLALQSRTSKSKRTKKSSRLQAANMAKAAKERKLSVGAQFKVGKFTFSSFYLLRRIAFS